ncbi:hypothetical protein FQN57_007352 [Myotisia sp. PD_48]|nr:hypothetical protein FQN57_007352 [Myotisia sp. PD_48]
MDMIDAVRNPSPVVRPCIAELIRTKYEPPELVLRVEKVIETPIVFIEPQERDGKQKLGTEVFSSIKPAHRTYRVFLGDGQYVIQALLTKELHYFVSTMGEIIPGAIIKLEEYEVQIADRYHPPTEDRSQLSGGGKVIYLAIERFRIIAYPPRPPDGTSEVRIERGNIMIKIKEKIQKRYYGEDYYIKLRKEQKQRRKRRKVTYDASQDALEDSGGDSDVNTVQQLSAPEEAPSNSPMDLDKSEVKELPSILDSGPDEEPASSTSEFPIADNATGSRPINHQIKEAPSNSQIHLDEPEVKERPSILDSELEKKSTSTSELPITDTNSSLRPIDRPPGTQLKSMISLPRPTNLMPLQRSLRLRSLLNLLHPETPFSKRNYQCDIIAVISWISPTTIKRGPMPLKRELRLMDPTITETIDRRRANFFSAHRLPPSSDATAALSSSSGSSSSLKYEYAAMQGISLSVFVDAAHFTPPEGSIALFRGLRTHEWDGISLNAYENDCKGKDWFISDPKVLTRLGVNLFAVKNWWLQTRERWDNDANAQAGDGVKS